MKIMPRVLHFIESGGLYGAERVILNLSREMQTTGDFIPVVGCIVSRAEEPCDLYDAAVAQGTEAVRIVIPNSRFPLALWSAAQQLKRHGIDLIHSHGYKPSVYGHFIRLLVGIKVMATCHLWFEPQSAPLKTRLMMALEKRFYRSFHKVVAVSDPISQVLLDSGISPDKVEVVKNGVDMVAPEITEEQRQSLREEFGLTEGTYCLLNTARLTRQKGQATLIDLAARLRAEKISFRLLIVGQGPLEEELYGKIRSLQLEQEVILVGFRSDIPALLSLADVFLLPSLDEGMPMSLLEAVAAKVPVISTAVGDIPKLIRHEESGLIVQPESPGELSNAVQKLLHSPSKRENLAANAHALMAMHYSQQAMENQYHRIYEAVLKRGTHDT